MSMTEFVPGDLMTDANHLRVHGDASFLIALELRQYEQIFVLDSCPRYGGQPALTVYHNMMLDRVRSYE